MTANSPDAPPLLEITELTVRYASPRGFLKRAVSAAAVNAVSLTTGRGSFVALVGESGSGKTSIAKAVLGLAPISSGSVRLGGVELGGLRRRAARDARRAVQLVMQDPFDALDPLFRVHDLIEEPLLVHEHSLSKEARRLRVESALNAVGLDHLEFAARRPHELSGGQRQRVAVAAALVVEPSLLIADEPVSMLDVSVRAGVLHLLDRIRSERRMGILMITHDLPTALAFCDPVIVMRNGDIVAAGPPSYIRDQVQEPYTRALLDATPGRLAAAQSALHRTAEGVGGTA
jgi:peptide/nickel transport system ATP-binding protein